MPVIAEDARRGVLDPHAASEPGVSQHAQALLVAVDDVGPERRPAHPGLLAHAGVVGVGIGLALGRDEDLQQQPVEGGARDDGHVLVPAEHGVLEVGSVARTAYSPAGWPPVRRGDAALMACTPCRSVRSRLRIHRRPLQTGRPP